MNTKNIITISIIAAFILSPEIALAYLLPGEPFINDPGELPCSNETLPEFDSDGNLIRAEMPNCDPPPVVQQAKPKDDGRIQSGGRRTIPTGTLSSSKRQFILPAKPISTATKIKLRSMTRTTTRPPTLRNEPTHAAAQESYRNQKLPYTGPVSILGLSLITGIFSTIFLHKRKYIFKSMKQINE
jgi:hypothetical protein